MKTRSISGGRAATANTATLIHQGRQRQSWRAVAERVAPTHCALLITGETGTGKGHIARWVHEHSLRRDKPFIPVNCGALPESVIDSHLFGHARGAFSGAVGDHCGLVRAAQGGTLLLDEVGELPMSAQVRLLRLLEEREVQPVGYARPVKVDVRIIAATSSDLKALVERGGFRRDLYFRLEVVSIKLPTLRERIAEIEPLLEQFNNEFATLYRQQPLRFDDEAMKTLRRYDWPGNVRELRTLVERLHVLGGCDAGDDGESPRTITAADLASFGQLRQSHAAEVGPAAVRLLEFKQESIQHALSACNGNMSRAASSLGVHRSTLYRWLAESGA